MKFSVLVALAAAGAMAATPSRRDDSPVYTASKTFPTQGFDGMYYMPEGTEQQPRPKINRVDGQGYFPDSIANPYYIPPRPPSNEAVYPRKKESGDKENVISNIFDIGHQLFGNGNDNSAKCKLCRSALSSLKELVLIDPELLPEVAESICKTFNLATLFGLANQCEGVLGKGAYGPIAAQLLAYGDYSGDSTDGQAICAMSPVQFCDWPDRTLSDDFLDNWFGGSRHAPQHVVDSWEKKRDQAHQRKSDNLLRVAHVSDLHIDPRYLVGSEANCQYGDTIECCRMNSRNYGKYAGYVPWGQIQPWMIDEPANYWGAYKCDTPWSLMGASMEALKSVGGESGYDLALFTGDITAHDDIFHYSREFVLYSQQAIMDILKEHLGDTPLMPTLGNHDSSPLNLWAPHSLPDGRGNQFSWDSDYVAKLWSNKGFIDGDAANQVRRHYGAYSMSPRNGLRVISLNTDFWYKFNFFNFINSTNPDVSGMLRFLTDELFAAEEAGERVWIIGHVLTGWDGADSMDGPSNLFYQIVSRFAPQTIAHVFFGHTHEDQFHVYYYNDNGNPTTASQDTRNVVANAFVAPSVTTYTNLNPTFRVYQVDPETYEVYDFDQYYSEVDEFDDLINNNRNHGPVWRHLYSARESYGNFGKSQSAGKYVAPVQLDQGWWPDGAPLNASFWSALIDEMSVNPSVLDKFSKNQSSGSKKGNTCENDTCRKANECYMRSGTSTQGRRCNQDYASMARG
ncbi:hypothetical protein MCUN1_003414 [Malassezia cuniculi]|uniref:Sphingomyelin phosphodiesterase n=1 Tax=Malassezia cuniculi TaxID=948313 RepID=A0AAF0ETG8_9BASI|nr:hypothetical protein MCUN1_003414 [Malassezia cuniculi]